MGHFQERMPYGVTQKVLNGSPNMRSFIQKMEIDHRGLLANLSKVG
jgi:hypothetical protein